MHLSLITFKQNTGSTRGILKVVMSVSSLRSYTAADVDTLVDFLDTVRLVEFTSEAQRDHQAISFEASSAHGALSSSINEM